MSENVANQLVSGERSFGSSGTIQASDGAGGFTGNANVFLDEASVHADYFIGDGAELSSTTGAADAIYGSATAVSQITVTDGRVTSISDASIGQTLGAVVDLGNTTSNTIQFDTDGKGVYYTGNVVVLSGLGQHAIRIGKGAGETGQTSRAVAIGQQAGQTNQAVNSTALGYQAGQSNQRSASVALGYQAAQTGQVQQSTAVGYQAGQTNQARYAVALGYQAGQTTQGTESVAVGANTNAANPNVSIGHKASFSAANSIGVGAYVELVGGNRAVCIGHQAKTSDQSVRIGYRAGYVNGRHIGVWLGYRSGENGNGGATAIGHETHLTGGNGGVCVGYQAQQTGAGLRPVAVGAQAGQRAQGSYAVAIGYQAGQSNQPDNSIVINATGSEFNSDGSNRLHIKPIRSATASNLLHSNITSGEITQSAIGKVVAAGVVNSDGSAVKQFGATTSRPATGDYTITFTTAFASGDDYVVNLAAVEDDAATPARNFKVYVKNGSRAAATVNVLTANDSTASDDTLTNHPFCYSIISLV